MENNHPINDLMAKTIEKIKESVDANTVVGTPITAGGITLIPVSKLSFGFGTGGTEYTKGAKATGEAPFGGGGGAGVKITPVCFLAVNGENVKILPMDPPAENTADRIVELIPEAIDKVTKLVHKKKDADKI